MGLTRRGSHNQGFLQPWVLQAGVLRTRRITTRGLRTTGSFNQGSFNTGFLQPGVLQPWVLLTRVFTTSCIRTRPCYNQQFIGGVYMTPGRLSLRVEFTPGSSHGSTFVYLIPPQKCHAGASRPGMSLPRVRTGARISLRDEIS